MKLRTLTHKEISKLEAEATATATAQIKRHYDSLRKGTGAFCIGNAERHTGTCPICWQNAVPVWGLQVFYGSHGPVCADCASRFCPELFELIDKSARLTLDCGFGPFAEE